MPIAMFDSITSTPSAHSSSSSLTLEETSIAAEKYIDLLDEEYATSSQSDKFWFEDRTVVIRVGNTLYKLYKGVLTQHPEFFASRITAVLKSPPSATVKKGKAGIVTYGDPQLVGAGSRSEPLFLLVKGDEFELLLSCIFPKDYNTQNDFTFSEWASIAVISKTLKMTSVRASAISNILKTTDTLGLIDAGNKHNLAECKAEGFRRLCAREDSLSLEEGQMLGLRSVIAIARGRDLLSRDFKLSEIEKAVLMDAGITMFEPQLWRIVPHTM